MSVREAKKYRQRLEIIQKTIELCVEKEIEQVRIPEIAQRSMISEATFFNYFSSKDALLSEWVHGWVQAALARAAATSDGASLRRSLRRVVAEVAEQAEANLPLSRAVASRVRVCCPGSERPGRSAIGQPARELVRSAQQRAEVRADLSCEQLAGLLEQTILGELVAWLAGERSSGEPLRTSLQRPLDLVLDGLRKRHERVKPVAARAAAES